MVDKFSTQITSSQQVLTNRTDLSERVEKIHHATRHGFEDDFPEVDRWLKNWKMDDDRIGELMSYVGDADDPLEGARQ